MRKNTYTIEWDNKAIKVLVGLKDQKLKAYILDAVENVIAHNPMIGKILSGNFKGARSYRLGIIRIIYKQYKDRLLVVVLNIAHRKEVYK
jgi:mRNA interferase RelE/StbE